MGDKKPIRKSYIPEALRKVLNKTDVINKDVSNVKDKALDSRIRGNDNIIKYDPEKAASENGVNVKAETQFIPFVPGSENGIETRLDAGGAVDERVTEILKKRSEQPKLTKNNELPPIPGLKDIIPPEQLQQDNTRVSTYNKEGYMKAPRTLTESPKLELGQQKQDQQAGGIIPGREQGRTELQTVGDFGSVVENSLSKWLNSIYYNIVNPDMYSIPINPFVKIPLGKDPNKKYNDMWPDWMKKADQDIKNFRPFAETPEDDIQEPVKFVGDLTGGMIPIILAGMTGLPPSVSFPMIQIPEINEQLKKGEITQSDANWEIAASTLMGKLFEMPIAKTLFKGIQDLPVKESTKLGLTKAGDVLFKTIGTGMIDATKQMTQGYKPDFNEVATNAGTIFVMELFGGHKKIQKMAEKFGSDRMLKFGKDFAENKPLDAEIQSEVEAIHNKPITDVRKLLVGPREHKFEIDPAGQIVEIKKNDPQSLLLSTLEKTYGMKPDEIITARGNVETKPLNVENANYEGGFITRKDRLLPPERQQKFEVTPKGEVNLYKQKQAEEMLILKGGNKSTEGKDLKEILKSQRRISYTPKIDNGVLAIKDPVNTSRLKQLEKEFIEARGQGKSYSIWTEKNKDMYNNSIPEVRQAFSDLAAEVQNWNKEILGYNVKTNELPKQELGKEDVSKKPDKIDTKMERVDSVDMKESGKEPALDSRVPRIREDGNDSMAGEVKAGDPLTSLRTGDKVTSKYYKNPVEELEVVDPRKDNMVKVKDAKGFESLISKNGVEIKYYSAENKDPGLRKVGDVQRKAEDFAAEYRKSRGKNRKQLEPKVTKAIDEYVKAYEEYNGEKFRADKETTIGKVLEYLKAKENIKGRGGKFGLQSSVTGGFNPENLPDLIKIGKFHYDNLVEASKTKAVNFGDWARRMVEEYGDYVKPRLREIYAAIKSPKQELGQQGKKAETKDKSDDVKFSSSGEIKTPSNLPLGKGETRFSSKEPEQINDVQKERKIQQEIKDNPGIERKEAYNIVAMKEKYYELKNERRAWTEGSAKYKELTEKMNTLKNKIEITTSAGTYERRMAEDEPVKKKEDIYKDIVKKLPDYESKVNSLGYTGEDAIEQVRKLIKRDLQTNKSYQRLSSGEKYGLTKALDEKFKVLNKERLQISADMDEPYAERRLRRWFKRGILQSLTLVEKMGEGGKEFAVRMRKFQDRERELMGDASVLAMDAGKLTSAEYKNLTAIRKAMMMEMPNVPKPINDNVKMFNERLNDYYSETAVLLRKRGFETTNPSTGEVYEFTPKKDYDPRMLEVNLDKLGIQRDKNGNAIFNQARERQLEYMVEGGQARTKSEASDMLDQFIQQEKVKIGKMGNVEYSRIKDIEFAPDMYIQDPMRRFINYATKISRRIAHEEQFGMDGGTVLRLLDRIKSEHYDEAFARDLYRYETNNLTLKEREAMSDVNFIKSLNAVTKFSPFTTLRNSLQGVLGSSLRGNLKSAITGFVRTFSPQVRKNAYQSGALADTIESVVMREFAGDSPGGWGKFVSGYLRWIGFTGTDRFNRVIGASAGEVFYKDMLKRLQKQTPSNLPLGKGETSINFRGRAMREFKKMGLDAEAVVKRGKFTEDELNLIRRTFAGDTQFNIRPSDLPLWWSSPIGKIVTQWKPFSYKMTQLIRDNVIAEIKKGNPMPLITMVAAYGVGGEAVNTIIDLVRGFLNFNPRKEEKEKGIFTRSAYMRIKEADVEGLVYRLVDDYAGLGALSFLVDMFRSMGYGKSGSTLSGVTSALLGPTVSTFLSATADVTGPILKKIWSEEGEWDEAMKNLYRGLYRNVLTNVPIGAIPRTFGLTKLVENKIWPPKTSVKEEIYSELEEQGVDIDKLEDLDLKDKEVKKLHNKAKETKNKADIDAYVKADEELDKEKKLSDEYAKYQEMNAERNQGNAELFGTGDWKIYNELKQKGINIEPLKEIDKKEREVNRLKQKADASGNAEDKKNWRTAGIELQKLKNKSAEYKQYLKEKQKQEAEKKKNFK